MKKETLIQTIIIVGLSLILIILLFKIPKFNKMPITNPINIQKEVRKDINNPNTSNKENDRKNLDSKSIQSSDNNLQ